MVLESVLRPIVAERHPLWAMFYGFVFATLSLFLAFWIFSDYASLVMVFLTALACSPLLYATIAFEEGKDLVLDKQTSILKEHAKALTFLMLLFVGFAVAYAFWYVVLPTEMANSLFFSQTEAISEINTKMMGSATSAGVFSNILLNNMKVLTFCILFGFVYGLGAIFILTWNASVLGAAIGGFIQAKISAVAHGGAYFVAASLSLLRYLIHGLPEMASYFLGGLAGGIVSIALIKKHYRTPRFEKVVVDATVLVLIALVVLLAAAIIEVYITPLFF